MTILDLQRRIREAGRIRIGQQVATSNGKRRPAKLETFRVTSPDRRAIEGVAELYGGEPQRWQAPAGPQWEVVTTSDELHVIVPPSDMAFSQWYEQWSGGGCQRRCDGATEQLTDGPCLCDPDERECTPHTRLSVMLRDLPGLGVWRIDTQGFYAAVELQSAMHVVQAAAGAGVMLPARLRLEQRQIKRPGVQTRNFAVPVLDVEVTPAQLLGGQAGGLTLGTGEVAAAPALGPASPVDAPALTAGEEAPAEEPEPARMQPVPSTVAERPVASVADQLAEPARRRKSQAAPIPRTGLAPRTAEQAEAGAPPERASAPEGVEPVDALQLMTVAKLKLRCKAAGQPVSGTKDELIDRLRGGDASGSSTSPEGDGDARDEDVPPPPDDPDDGAGERPYDRDGAQRAFHARLHDLGLDYETEVKPWMIAAPKLGTSLSKMSDTQLKALMWAMEERGEDFVATVRAHDPSAGGDGEAPPAEATSPPDLEGEVQVEGDIDANNIRGDDTPADPEPSLQERALARAVAASPQGTQRARIHRSWSTLSVRDRDAYAASWDRIRGLIGGDPSGADWSATSEVELRREAEQLEKAVRRLPDDGRG